MKKVLITGASGFIGSALFNKFENEKYNVVGWSKSVSNIFNNVDLLNYEKVRKELSKLKPDIIIHCAGSANVSLSIKEPKTDFEANVLATQNLLCAIYESEEYNPKFVFLSSAGIYGNPQKLPINEEASYNPLSPYALHKVMCEQMCLFYKKNYGLDLRIARIFSAYGVGLRKQIFWDLYQKYTNYGCLNVFGTGNESRDFIAIEDVVNAIYLIAISETDECIFNVANGEEITIREVVEVFAECVNIPQGFISFNGIVREGDPLNWKADISKIKKLGYKKTIKISEGLCNYVKWVRENS